MEELTLIDPSTFSELKATMGEEFLKDMVDTFCEDSNQLTKTIKQALIENNQAEFTRAAHTLKSTSLIFGALHFGALARELEQMGREGRTSGSDEKVTRLCKSLPELQTVLKDLCHGQ